MLLDLGQVVRTSGMDGLRNRRRHGDVFPLPPHLLRSEAVARGIQEPQQAYWAGQSLNKLALHGHLNSLSDQVLRSNLSLTAAQNSACDRILHSIGMYGDCPQEIDAEKALAGMRRDKPSYDGVPSNLASYDARKLKILRKCTQPQLITQFLPPQAAAMVKSFRTAILQEPSDSLETIRPYWDPLLRYDARARLDFIVQLFKAGLMELCTEPKSFVGVFFVKKKTPDQIRMVIDSRCTNRLCRDPPVTRLGSSRCYADLQLDRLQGTPGGPLAWGQEADVDDCFYRFSIPQLCEYFAIDHPLSKRLWQDLGVSCNHHGVADSSLLFPCFKVVPMGWNWALFLCNEAVVQISKNGSPWADGYLREKKTVPQLDEHRTVIGVYVDNITILGQCKDDVRRRATVLQQAFDQAGIPISWTQDEPSSCLDSVGCVLDLQSGVLMNKPKRVWNFVRASAALLKRRKLHGQVLQVWAGHFTALCGINPCCLSVLDHVYRFIQKALDGRIQVWSQVRREIKTASSIVWLTWRNLASGLMRVVEVGDSATSGYALMSCKPSERIIRNTIGVHERCRFIPMPSELREKADQLDIDGFSKILTDLLSPHDAPETKPQGVFKAAGLSTDYAKFVIGAMDDHGALKTSAIRSQVRASPFKRADIDVPALVEPLDDFFQDASHFRLLWARRWKDGDEHILIKESRVLLSSLKRSSRVVELHDRKKLSISDNLPAVCAFSKGRSPNRKVNYLCQQACAFQIACGISWSVRHIETKRNPADEPSRWYEKKSPKSTSFKCKGPRQRRVAYPVVEVGDSGYSREASAPSKPHQPRRQHVQNVFPSGSSKLFLEVFSGTGRLTQAVEECGISVLEPLDIVLGKYADLRRRTTQQTVLEWVKHGHIGFVHLGTPCTIWSRARHGVKDSWATRCKEETGVELALFSAELIRVCNRYKVPYAIENPRTSRLFSFEPLVVAIASGPNYIVDFDMCQYGEPYQKGTRIITSVPWLTGLSRRCNHKGHEVWLKGRVLAPNPAGTPVYVNRTALAGAYPFELVKKYASLIANHAGLNHGSKQFIQVHWGAALRSAAEWQARNPKSRSSAVNMGSSTDNSLKLLSKAGGLERFYDAIALGRAQSKEKAWGRRSC